MAREPTLRAGDADRDQVAAALREHFAAGRLTQAELSERLDAALAARTLGDLVPLMADLPALEHPAATPDQAPRAAAPRPGARSAARTGAPDGRSGRSLQWAWTAWARLVAINVVIWLLVSVSTGGWVYFWPMWVAGPWGAVLLSATVFGRRRPEGGNRLGA